MSIDQGIISGPTTGPEITDGPTHDPTPEAYARRGIKIACLREGTPLQATNFLCDMERKGEISNGILDTSDDNSLPLGMEEDIDSDLDFADEDVFPLEKPEIGRQPFISIYGDWAERDSSAFEQTQMLEICVYVKINGDVSCSIKKDPRIGFDCYLHDASGKIKELSYRYEVLERLGNWLVENRLSFLHSFDLWDFAEQALEEAKRTKLSVVQKDFIAIANLGCKPDSFSRFIKNTVLSRQVEFRRDDGTMGCRDEGCMEISMLFSKEAKWAWAARAFLDYCRKARLEGKEVMDYVMKEFLIPAKADKKGKAERNRLPFISLRDAGVIASRLCELADVRSADVVSLIQEKFQEA